MVESERFVLSETNKEIAMEYLRLIKQLDLMKNATGRSDDCIRLFLGFDSCNEKAYVTELSEEEISKDSIFCAKPIDDSHGIYMDDEPDKNVKGQFFILKPDTFMDCISVTYGSPFMGYYEHMVYGADVIKKVNQELMTTTYPADEAIAILNAIADALRKEGFNTKCSVRRAYGFDSENYGMSYIPLESRYYMQIIIERSK